MNAEIGNFVCVQIEYLAFKKCEVSQLAFSKCELIKLAFGECELRYLAFKKCEVLNLLAPFAGTRTSMKYKTLRLEMRSNKWDFSSFFFFLQDYQYTIPPHSPEDAKNILELRASNSSNSGHKNAANNYHGC